MSERFGSLLIVLAALTTLVCGCSSSSPTAPPPPAPPPTVVIVSVNDFSFNPKSLSVNPGDTVRWVQAGSVTDHTTTALQGNKWDSGFVFLQPGDFFEYRFTAADNNGTFEYLCVSHEVTHGMRGSILVGSDAAPPLPGY